MFITLHTFKLMPVAVNPANIDRMEPISGGWYLVQTAGVKSGIAVMESPDEVEKLEQEHAKKLVYVAAKIAADLQNEITELLK